MNTTLTSLTETIVENGKTILAATLITRGSGEGAHRIVLRYVKDKSEFVVHLEMFHVATVAFTGDPVDRDNHDCYVHAGYTDGYYTESFAKAFCEFTRRAMLHLDKLQPLRARLGS